jgi:hypothetical protein
VFEIAIRSDVVRIRWKGPAGAAGMMTRGVRISLEGLVAQGMVWRPTD